MKILIDSSRIFFSHDRCAIDRIHISSSDDSSMGENKTRIRKKNMHTYIQKIFNSDLHECNCFFLLPFFFNKCLNNLSRVYKIHLALN